MPALRACSPAAMPCLIVGANLMSTARLRWKSAYIFFLVLVTAQWGRCCCQQEQQRQEADVCNDGPAATHSDADTMATYPRAPDKSTRLVRELLSPFSLQDFAENYWERMPLVIRGRSHNHYERLVDFGTGDVDTVIRNGVSLSGGGEDHMVLGSDWNIIKRVFVQADGEFWSAGLPLESTSAPSSPAKGKPARGNAPAAAEVATEAEAAEGGQGAGARGGGEERVAALAAAREAFQLGGFSVVINRLQRRWRGASELSLALEDVLGQPVNANMYMTPPDGQGFEAHFDWMDGIVVQLAGSKTWILYDEMMPAPRPDLKFKPTAADLGEPIAVLELHPGDLMYIPRGWPHEAAVNGTRNADAAGRSRGAREPSLHVTFGIESALSGTYESLVHHALEVAAAEHPELFGLSKKRKPKERTNTDERDGFGSSTEGQEAEAIYPWLQLLHLLLHEAASRDTHLRRAVPLAPLFSPASPSTTPDTPPTAAAAASDNGNGNVDDDLDSPRLCLGDAAPPRAPPAIIVEEFHRALEAFLLSSGSADASSTSSLLASLSNQGKLERVWAMFRPSGPDGEEEQKEEEDRGGVAAAASAGLSRGDGLPFSWDRTALEALDRASFPASLRAKVEGFLHVASTEGALGRMVKAATLRARKRAAVTERDLARCGQG